MNKYYNVRLTTDGFINLKKLVGIYTEKEKIPQNQTIVLEKSLTFTLNNLGV